MAINNDNSTVRGRAPVALLAAATANGSGTFDFVETRASLAVQVILAGTVVATGGTVALYASLDGVNYDPVALSTWTIGTDASGTIQYVTDKPFRKLKATLAGLTGGTAPTVTCVVGVP